MQRLNAVEFVDDNRGWAVGGAGTIVATKDGGTSWAAQTSGTTYSLFDVTFVDADRGWAVGGAGTILSTTDGGVTWTAQSSGTSTTFQAVTFPDAMCGWAVGGLGVILATTDGGQSWKYQNIGPGPAGETTASWRGVSVTASGHGGIVDSAGEILRTETGGHGSDVTPTTTTVIGADLLWHRNGSGHLRQDRHRLQRPHPLPSL